MNLDAICGAHKTTDNFGTVRCMKLAGHSGDFHFHITQYGYRVVWTDADTR